MSAVVEDLVLAALVVVTTVEPVVLLLIAAKSLQLGFHRQRYTLFFAAG
jgi:hypothetical protein